MVFVALHLDGSKAIYAIDNNMWNLSNGPDKKERTKTQ